MKLTRLFAISTVVLVTLIGLMLSRIIFAEWNTYQSSRAGLVAMQVAYKAMVLAEKVSFERGPTNGVLIKVAQTLGDGPPITAAGNANAVVTWVAPGNRPSSCSASARLPRTVNSPRGVTPLGLSVV